MPIRKEMRKLYPPNWRRISARIRFIRAGYVCECGLHHDHRCIERHGQPAKYARGKVVLTVAHLNHDPTDCRDENLRAMCQRCHLRYDKEHHAETRGRG